MARSTLLLHRHNGPRINKPVARARCSGTAIKTAADWSANTPSARAAGRRGALGWHAHGPPASASGTDARDASSLNRSGRL